MRLGIVTHRVMKGDGQGRVNYEVAWEALRRGYNVTVIASTLAPDLQSNSQVSWLPVSVKGVPTAFLRNLLFSWKSANWLRKHRCGLDVVKTNGAITSAPADVNAVHFVHSSWIKSPVHTWQQRRDAYSLYQFCYTAFNAYWEKRAFRQAKVIVAVSENTKIDLIKIGIPANQVHVIENGVDLQEFCPGKIARQQFCLPEDVPLALFVGDLQTPRKNLETVLQALVQIPQLHLAIAGTTAGSPYPRLSEALGLSKQVHFLGFQSNVAALMRAVDFFVFPSRYETFGLVILEAMASGLPVITASTTGAADLITDEAGFVLSDPNDTQALVKVLKTLMDHPQCWVQMGQAARAIAEHHSWERKAKSYVDLFEKLASHEYTC